MIFFIIIHSFKPFIVAFEKWLSESLIIEINKILPRDSEMVRRHFQVKWKKRRNKP